MGQRFPQYLFDDNPPDDEEFIRSLFFDREQELQFALSLLRTGTAFRKICAVHGMTRCGKSHLVLRLLVAVREQGLPYLVFSLNANNRGTARSFLDELFFEFWKAIQMFPADDLPEGTGHAYGAGMAFLAEMEPLIAQETSEASLTQTREVVEEAGVAVKLVPPPFQVDLSGRVTDRAGQIEQWTRQVPSDRHLVELIRYQSDLLGMLHPGKTLLLLVDDLDLLDRPGTPGQDEADCLVDLLPTLAASPSLVVLATIRYSYFNGRQKDLKDFVEVRLLGSADLAAIYRRHIKIFNDSQDVFDPEALKWIAHGSAGRVGVFLHRCYQLWRRFGLSVDGLLGLEHVRQYVQEDIQQLRQDPTHWEILAAIESTLREERLELTLPGDLGDTALMFKILVPLAGRPGAYSINPVYAEVIQEMQESQG